MNGLFKNFPIGLSVMFPTIGFKEEKQKVHQVISNNIKPVNLFIENQIREQPKFSSEPIFESRTHRPVVDREGNQLSLGDFSRVRGSASIEAVDGGTQVRLSLNGLIPNGKYTLWNATFGAPGFDPAAKGMNLIGYGTLGRKDGPGCSFRASATGTGWISTFIPAGVLSLFGRISAHPFYEEVEWHIVGMYHMDEQSSASRFPAEGTAVEQFALVIKNLS